MHSWGMGLVRADAQTLHVRAKLGLVGASGHAQHTGLCAELHALCERLAFSPIDHMHRCVPSARQRGMQSLPKAGARCTAQTHVPALPHPYNMMTEKDRMKTTFPAQDYTLGKADAHVVLAEGRGLVHHARAAAVCHIVVCQHPAWHRFSRCRRGCSFSVAAICHVVIRQHPAWHHFPRCRRGCSFSVAAVCHLVIRQDPAWHAFSQCRRGCSYNRLSSAGVYGLQVLRIKTLLARSCLRYEMLPRDQ